MFYQCSTLLLVFSIRDRFVLRGSLNIFLTSRLGLPDNCIGRLKFLNQFFIGRSAEFCGRKGGDYRSSVFTLPERILTAAAECTALACEPRNLFEY